MYIFNKISKNWLPYLGDIFHEYWFGPKFRLYLKSIYRNYSFSMEFLLIMDLRGFFHGIWEFLFYYKKKMRNRLKK